MSVVHVDVEGHKAFEFGDEEQLTAGAIEIRIRTSLRLQGGSIRQGLRAFGENRILEAGVYTFDEFAVEGKHFLVLTLCHMCSPRYFGKSVSLRRFHHVSSILEAILNCSNGSFLMALPISTLPNDFPFIFSFSCRCSERCFVFESFYNLSFRR